MFEYEFTYSQVKEKYFLAKHCLFFVARNENFTNTFGIDEI